MFDQERTNSIIEQEKTENMVLRARREHIANWKNQAEKLSIQHHSHFLYQRLGDLPSGNALYDASQTWLAYWTIHGLVLLKQNISPSLEKGVIDLMSSCQSKDGGFGGGPHQLAHLATTYAAVNTLTLLRSKEALEVINRAKLRKWLESLKREDGAFCMHHGGEYDVRGAYCAISVSRLCGILDPADPLFRNTAEWIAKCQSYEGGFSGQPHLEAHGGYTYCATAALSILGRLDIVDVDRLLDWTVHRQMAKEGGFQGRTNKLVDSCYSFWMCAVVPMVRAVLMSSEDSALDPAEPLVDTEALQNYVILCCQKVPHHRPGLSVPNSSETVQNASTGGGLIDKPGKNPDAYHTCYSLSGLSVAQHLPRQPVGDCDICRVSTKAILGHPCPAPAQKVVGEAFGNTLVDVHLWHNVTNEAVEFALTYYSNASKD